MKPDKQGSGRPKGLGKVPGSGRKKGTKNKRTRELEEKLQAVGCDPLTGLARIALNRKNPPELRFKAFAELMPYRYPKRKSVEIATEDGEPFVFQFLGASLQTE